MQVQYLKMRLASVLSRVDAIVHPLGTAYVIFKTSERQLSGTPAYQRADVLQCVHFHRPPCSFAMP